MRLEISTVSRKTPLDGKLAISDSTADRLTSLGATVPVRLEGAAAAAGHAGIATLTDMECTCAKSRTTGVHIHRFLQSDLFRALPVDQRVALDFDPSGIVLVHPAEQE